MQSEIHMGIIGAGNIAREHLKVIQSLEDVRVSGISSRTVVKAQALANEYEIEQVYEGIDSLIEKCAPDALLVLVSADQIFGVTQELIQSQVPLFIEKPPGLNPEETRTLAKLAEKHSTKNMVGYNRRYYSIFHKGLEIINAHGGLLGVTVEGHERFWKIIERGVPEMLRENWIYANSTHTIDLLRLFGGNVKRIHALKSTLKEKNGDQFVAALEFESGSLGTYTSHWFSPGGWSVRLYGDGVTVEYKPLEKGTWTDTDFSTHEILSDEVDEKYKPGFYRQMQAFVGLVTTGQLSWPGIDLESAIITMKLAQKCAHG
jgi:predicted dehydrogenase